MLKKIYLVLFFLSITAVILANGASEPEKTRASILVVLPQKDSYDAQILLESLRLQALAQNFSINILFQEDDNQLLDLPELLSGVPFECLVIMTEDSRDDLSTSELQSSIDIPIIFTGIEPETLINNNVFIGPEQQAITVLYEYLLDTYSNVKNGLYLTQDTSAPLDLFTDEGQDVDPQPIEITNIAFDQDKKIHEITEFLTDLVLAASPPPDFLVTDTKNGALKIANYLHQEQLIQTVPLFALTSSPDILQFVTLEKITSAIYVDYFEIGQEIFKNIETVLLEKGRPQSKYTAIYPADAAQAEAILMQIRNEIGVE